MKKPRAFPPGAGLVLTRCAPELLGLHFVGLQALLALHDLERNLLAFLQRLEAGALDRTEVDEEVLAAFGGDETEALGVVESLDGAVLTIGHDLLLLGTVNGNTARAVRRRDCIEQGVTRNDGADRLDRPFPAWYLLIYRIGATMYRDPALNSGRTIPHFRPEV